MNYKWGSCMKIKIRKGGPVPPKGAKGIRRKASYPWRTMDVGDSFVFPPYVSISSAAAHTINAGRRTGRKFTARIIKEGSKVRVGCWREA